MQTVKLSVQNVSSKNSGFKNTDRQLRTMAETIFSQLQKDGCRLNEIISVSGHLLAMVTTSLKGTGSASND